MQLRHLWLADFRSYTRAEVVFPPGLTAVLGDNGAGKTNLLEAIAWLATLESFRGAPTEALIREGAPQAAIRAEVERDGRELLLEAELARAGRNRFMVNRQTLRRARDLLGALRVSVFTPDDLVIVKGSPGERRRYLDETLVALHARNDALRRDVDRVLRQRGALLKQAGGKLASDVEATLDVWDRKLADAGEALAMARVELVAELQPVLGDVYATVAQRAVDVTASYQSTWLETGLGAALHAARRTDLARATSTVGPHRDDLELRVDGRPARTHASQGEQRSLALALRLASHHVVTAATGAAPVMLLDDVFSELDPHRSDALVTALPNAQTVLTTAAGLPRGASPERVLVVSNGTVTRVDG
jgi:DNA replication and repair protein RecF